MPRERDCEPVADMCQACATRVLASSSSSHPNWGLQVYTYVYTHVYTPAHALVYTHAVHMPASLQGCFRAPHMQLWMVDVYDPTVDTGLKGLCSCGLYSYGSIVDTGLAGLYGYGL